MSQPNGIFETLIAALTAHTAAVEANTAALNGAGGSTTKTTKTTSTTKKAEDKPKSKYTKEQTSKAIVALKEAAGSGAAKELLTEHGFAKLVDITEDKFDVLHDGAVAALEAFKAEKGGEEEEDI